MRFFKSGELKLLWPFYLESLVSSMLFFMPAFSVVYFRDLNFGLFQISLLFMMMSLFGLLFEIPTGAVADIYGRKFSVLLGAIINGITIISIFFLSNYYALLFAFGIIGLGEAFNSGAREAWVTDLIKKEKKNFLHGYFAKSGSIDGIELVISGLIGAFLVKQFGVSIIWIFAGASFFVTFLLLSFAKEHFVKRKAKIKSSLKNIIRQSNVSIRYAKNHPVLFLFLMATSLLVFASAFNGNLAWITFLQGLNFPEHAFGYMWSAMGAVSIFAPFISIKLLKRGNERKFLSISVLLSAFVVALVFFVETISFALFILFSYLFFVHMSRPVERIYFHKFIKSKLRATIGSVESMLIWFVGILAMPLAGLSVDYLGARYTILLSALLMIPSAIIFFKIKESKKKEENKR